MNISDEVTIAIETSGRAGSAALSRGGSLLSEVIFSDQMRHSTELFTALQELLKQADARPIDIKQCYITAGPGSFTGLRIAVTAAKMLSFAQNIQIVAVDTMDVLAENIFVLNKDSGEIPDCFSTIIDAKKGLFFSAVYQRNERGWKKIFDTQIVTAFQLLDRLRNCRHPVSLLGEGLVYYADQFEAPFTSLLDRSYWSARASGLLRAGYRLAQQGHFADPLQLKPRYLRQPDVIVPQSGHL